MTILFVALRRWRRAHTKTSNGQIHDCCLQAAERKESEGQAEMKEARFVLSGSTLVPIAAR